MRANAKAWQGVLATFPPVVINGTSVMRAKITDGQIERILPPEYHGDPVSADGFCLLMRTDFGWVYSKGFKQQVSQRSA